MTLHEDKELFMDCISNTANYLGYYDESIIEKDYFVTLFLNHLLQHQSNVIFRGGTALSKCFKIVSRFSEDIDLSLDVSGEKPTQGQLRRWKQSILDTVSELGFEVMNLDKTRSRRDFNLYEVKYNTCYPITSTNNTILVETSVLTKVFPTNHMPISYLIYDWLESVKALDVIDKYDLTPFNLSVQAIERTFIDKVFALADYYIDKRVSKHSRHIYDLYKMYPNINFDSGFLDLVKEVRLVRSKSDKCFSAKDGVNPQDVLKIIVNESIYKSDYENTTSNLLFEDVSYSTAISVLEKIISDGFFSFE